MERLSGKELKESGKEILRNSITNSTQAIQSPDQKFPEQELNLNLKVCDFFK